MRIARIDRGGEVVLCVVDGAKFHILTEWPDMESLIRDGAQGLEGIRKKLSAGAYEQVEFSQEVLCAPFSSQHRDILCTGWNYYEHFSELVGKRGAYEVERPNAPTFFTKSPGVMTAPYSDINFDRRISQKWDYEAEIAVIIGKRGRSIPSTRADEHVWGYCLANDISMRDLQRRHGGQWLKGKSIDGTMPMGPWVTTKDDFDVSEARIRCDVNGINMQDAHTKQMAHTIAELIAELSLGMTLEVGDVLLTGTPSGIGAARKPPVFIKENDVVTVSCQGLGELHNKFVESDLYGDSDVVLPWLQEETVGQ